MLGCLVLGVPIAVLIGVRGTAVLFVGAVIGGVLIALTTLWERRR